MGRASTNVDDAIYALLASWGAWLGGPIGAGRIFFVDGINGNNGNIGTDPNFPWLTITYALTQCVNDRNDYIIVLDHWQEVVNINVTRVHIIGLSNFLRPNSNHSFVQMNAAADTAIFTISALSNNCEIAGFSFGGGATHAGIENAGGTPMGVHIHDCVFGHSFAGGTPRDGILIGLNATNIRIEDCVFLGAPGGKGTLTRDGIRWAGAGDPLNGYIGENEFKALPGVGINFVSVANATGGITIKDNIFSCESDKQGAAITLAPTTRGFLVSGNKALYGPTTAAMANNPYLDQTTVAPFNAWMANYKGNVLIDPA
jgi:hypothetical protein